MRAKKADDAKAPTRVRVRVGVSVEVCVKKGTDAKAPTGRS